MLNSGRQEALWFVGRITSELQWHFFGSLACPSPLLHKIRVANDLSTHHCGCRHNPKQQLSALLPHRFERLMVSIQHLEVREVRDKLSALLFLFTTITSRTIYSHFLANSVYR